MNVFGTVLQNINFYYPLRYVMFILLCSNNALQCFTAMDEIYDLYLVFYSFVCVCACAQAYVPVCVYSMCVCVFERVSVRLCFCLCLCVCFIYAAQVTTHSEAAVVIIRRS